jgi:hypothetical protein
VSAPDDRAPADQGIRFFGQATAGLTHEMKNCLAMINEFNGLIGDLVMAHERGHPLNLERIKSLVVDIRRHVAKGGEITAHLNRFAHCVDEQWAEVDLGSLLRLFVALAQRRTQRRGVTLELAPLAGPLNLRTRPLLLLTAWQQGLDALLACVEGQDRVLLSLREEPGWAWVGFACPAAGQTGATGPAFDSELVAALGARPDQDSQGPLLGLPREPDDQPPAVSAGTDKA